MPNPEWRLIASGEADGFSNMALDEALLLLFEPGSAPPTVRFYAWSPPCLSLGYSQSLAEVDLEQCTREGLDCVRRLTGGRAVLHQRDFTYSLVASTTDPRLGGRLEETYRQVTLGLLAGLQGLGLEAALERGDTATKARTGACFDAPLRHELLVQGRKIAGSAQRRWRGLFLQQGTLPLEMDSRRLYSLLRPRNQGPAPGQTLEERALSLSQALDRKVTWGEVAQAMRRGFEQAWNVTLIESPPTDEEVALARKLRAEKYQTVAWNALR